MVWGETPIPVAQLSNCMTARKRTSTLLSILLAGRFLKNSVPFDSMRVDDQRSLCKNMQQIKKNPGS